MRPDASPRYAVRPVVAVAALVLAVVLGFSAVMSGPGASADPGAEAGGSSTQTDSGSVDPSESADSETDETESVDPDNPTDTETTESASPPESTESAEPEPSESDRPETDGVEVDNAVFRWGINNQSNARSHNPGAYNFFSAGVANPGRGGVHLLEKHWRAKSGNVLIQKWMGRKRGWRTAAWEGWKTNEAGKPTGVDRDFSLHNIVIRGGTGTIDRASGTAEIRWKGTFTVVYYSGNTIFTVTDPVLTVADGRGELTGVLGGFASERDNMSQWKPVTPVRATVATLDAVRLGKRGFSSTPAYEGVQAKGFADQVTDGRWGAFPQSMLDFLKPLAIAQFWYSTGLATDDTKLPLPLTVSYDEADEVTPTPTPEPSAPPTVDNPVNNAPPPAPQQAPQVAAPAPAAAAPGLPAEVPESHRQLLAAADLGAVTPVAASPAEQGDPDRTWWLVGSLLLVAALLLFIPARPRRT